MRSRIRPIRVRMSSRDSQPFPSPKHSQANQSGRLLHPAKYPNPAIARCGAFSLNRKGEKCGAAKGRRSEGVQKFTSATLRRARNSYQPKSVTATVPANSELTISACAAQAVADGVAHWMG